MPSAVSAITAPPPQATSPLQPTSPAAVEKQEPAPAFKAAPQPVPAQPPVGDDGPPEPDDWHLFEPPADIDFTPVPSRVASGEKNRGTARAYTAPSDPLPVIHEPKPRLQEEARRTVEEPMLIPEPPRRNPPVESIGIPASKAPSEPREPVSPAFLSMPFYVPPASKFVDSQEDEENEPRRLTVILKPSENKDKDVRRLKRVHGTLIRYPGNDKFALLVFEQGRRFFLEFPNDTTGICSELIRELIELVGEGNVTVESIKLQ